MEPLKCECFCGCSGQTDDLFQCCDMWFCTECFGDHVEDDHYDSEG